MLQSTGKGGGGSDWAILVAEEEGDSNREGTVLEQRWQRAGEKDDVSNGSRGDGGSNWQYETRWQRDAIGSCNQGLEGNNDDNTMI
ncbi:hypothetical protein GW17_00005751 [Ensete ventricosum]|nr:hypothetical protein GW17_00005751 [Ensete ventricosum]